MKDKTVQAKEMRAEKTFEKKNEKKGSQPKKACI